MSVASTAVPAPSAPYLLVPGAAAGAAGGPWLDREMSAPGLVWALTQLSLEGRKCQPSPVTWGCPRLKGQQGGRQGLGWGERALPSPGWLKYSEIDPEARWSEKADSLGTAPD